MRSRHREAGGRSWRACCHLGRHRRGPERLPSTRGAVLSRAALQEVPDQDHLSGRGAGVRAGDGVQPRGVRPGGHWAPSPGARGSGKSQLPHTGASRSMIPGPHSPAPRPLGPGRGTSQPPRPWHTGGRTEHSHPLPWRLRLPDVRCLGGASREVPQPRRLHPTLTPPRPGKLASAIGRASARPGLGPRCVALRPRTGSCLGLGVARPCPRPLACQMGSFRGARGAVPLTQQER